MAVQPFNGMTGPFTAFPYLTGTLPTWPVPSYGTGADVRGAYYMTPDENPQAVVRQHRVIVLQGGEVYHWKKVHIEKPTIIVGNGATIMLDGDGPSIFVDGQRYFPFDMNVYISDVNFQAASPAARDQPMTEEYIAASAVWVKNAARVAITECTFQNFNGAAIWFYADDTSWNGRTVAFCEEVRGNHFQGCRIGVAVGKNTQYGTVHNNTFFDCHVAFYMAGSNWCFTGNTVLACRSAYFHLKDNMWYEGVAEGNDTFMGTAGGNFISNAGISALSWHPNFVAPDGTGVKLQGFYYDDDASVPPTWNGNTHYWSGIDLLNMPNTVPCYTFSGCTFLGNTTNTSLGRINVPEALKTKVFFTGCSGNGVDVYNVPSVNLEPEEFATLKNGTPL